MTQPPELDGSQVCWIDPAADQPDPDDKGPLFRESTAIVGERERLAAQGLTMVRREQWGAVRSYTDPRAVTMPAKRFFLHVAVIGSSASFYSRLRLIEKIGISRFPATGASYNAAVDFDGTLAELQPLARRGAHTVVEYAPNKMGLPNGHNANYDSRALVLPQNCPDRVTDEQIDSAARWAAVQIRAGLAVKGARWFGHRDAAPKACPCDAGYARIPWLQRLTDQYAATGPQPTDWYDDMATEDDLRRVVREEAAAIRADLVTAVWGHRIPNPGTGNLRAASAWLTSAGNSSYTAAVGIAEMLARPDSDVDEAALAAVLAPLLVPAIPVLSTEDLARIAAAVADETARRQAE